MGSRKPAPFAGGEGPELRVYCLSGLLDLRPLHEFSVNSQQTATWPWRSKTPPKSVLKTTCLRQGVWFHEGKRALKEHKSLRAGNSAGQDGKWEGSPSQISKKLDSGLVFLESVWKGGEGNYTNWPFHSQRGYQEWVRQWWMTQDEVRII